MSLGKDALVSAHATWVCVSSTVLQELVTTVPTDLEETGPDLSAQCEPVCLERAEEGLPCVVTLLCRPGSGAVVGSVRVVSEARTVEVYSLCGDYCGTSRGQEAHLSKQDSTEEKRCFYETHLVLEDPVASCELKLLSLGGRSTVRIARVEVGLRFLQTGPCLLPPSPGIDLQRVQTMMQEMGVTLSPGAQSLMDIVQFQQKNKSDMFGGFMPLLMGGGALAHLVKGSTPSPRQAGSDGDQAASGPHPHPTSANPGGAAGVQAGIGPELFPVLQRVCGQVTLQRQDSINASGRKNGEGDELPGCGGLEEAVEKVVEKHVEEMEKRLKEHMDTRLDALQRRLELTLQQVLTHSSVQQ